MEHLSMTDAGPTDPASLRAAQALYLFVFIPATMIVT
jgi:hypothetical protein